MHPVLHRVARRKQKNGYTQTVFTELAENFESASAGQHNIQHHKIELFRVQEVKTFFSRFRQRNLVTLILQPFLQGARQLRFVFHDEDMHAFFHIARLADGSN